MVRPELKNTLEENMIGIIKLLGGKLVQFVAIMNLLALAVVLLLVRKLLWMITLLRILKIFKQET
jgi:hypothetical protein